MNTKEESTIIQYFQILINLFFGVDTVLCRDNRISRNSAHKPQYQSPGTERIPRIS